MKKLFALFVLAWALGAAADSAWAHGGRGHGGGFASRGGHSALHGHHGFRHHNGIRHHDRFLHHKGFRKHDGVHHHHRHHGVLSFGPILGPYGWSGPSYYPYAPAYAAPAYPERYSGGYWYYCSDPEAYYPYVRECPSGWMRVVPQSPPDADSQIPSDEQDER